MYKKIRRYWWLLSNIVKKHYIFILLGVFINFGLSLLFIIFINSNIFAKSTKIGLIDNATVKTIPLEITSLISRGLTKSSVRGKYEADLAETINIKNDGKIYEIKLKKNQFWQNGKEFTTKDINYNFKDVTFVIKNKYEGYFILKEKYAPFLELLSIPITDSNLNGLGNYKVEKIDREGDFVKNIYLNGSKKVTYRFYPNQETAVIAFKLGEINILKNLTNLDNIKIWKKVKVQKEADQNKFAAIFFSFKGSSPMQEKSLRQAFAYAINKKIFSEKPAYSSYSFKSSFYTENIKKYFYDEQAAKNLFDKFQGTSKKKPTFTIYTIKEYEKYSREIAKNWSRIFGIKVDVKASEGIPYQWQMFLTISEIPNDPDQYALWHSNKTFRFSNYRNLKVDKFLEDGRIEIDDKKRTEIYDQLQKTLTEELPAIFLFYPNSYTLSY